MKELKIEPNVRKRTAKEDIICYKFVRKSDRCAHGCFETRYQNAKVEIGKTYTSILRREGFDKLEIGPGLHSYADIKACVYFESIQSFYLS